MQPQLTVLLAVVLSASVASALDCQTSLNTTTGPVCGLVTAAGGRNFVGVPYAQAERFGEPTSHPTWTSPIDCSVYGPGCVQTHHNPDVPEPQDEECHNLNIYMPSVAHCGAGPHPAMVWIHGGSFEEGGSSMFFYNATTLAENQCVVVVTGNYRLGVFGALIIDGVKGNQQLYDQRFMLQWVKDNAANLNIVDAPTVFGQSAGAMSIGFHLMSPNSQGLFRSAIMQSNPAGYVYKSKKEGTMYSKMFVDIMNCSDVGDANATLTCLRSFSSAEIIAGQKAVESNTKDIIKVVLDWKSLAAVLPFTPSVLEDEDWPLQPLEAFEKGKAMDVPIMIGSNEADAVLFVGCGAPLTSHVEFEAGVDIAFGAHGHRVLEHYKLPKHNHTENIMPIVSDLVTDFFFRCPSRRIAKAAAAVGNSKVFVYRFNHSLPFNIFNKSCCDNLPCHGVEIPLIFQGLGGFVLDPASVKMGAEMQQMWGNFARNGHPSTAAPMQQEWPNYNASTKGETMFFESDTVIVNESNGGLCDQLWDTFTPFWDKPSD